MSDAPRADGHVAIRSVAESRRSADHATIQISAPGRAGGMGIASLSSQG